MQILSVIFACVSVLQLPHARITPENFDVAFFVATEALAAGVDPRLALAVAYSESRVKPMGTRDDEPGDCCAGPMQVHTGYHAIETERYSEQWQALASAGVRVLAEYLRRAPTHTEALRWYNCGPRRARQNAVCGSGYARVVLANVAKLQ